jgi:hypothetical protein
MREIAVLSPEREVVIVGKSAEDVFPVEASLPPMSFDFRSYPRPDSPYPANILLQLMCVTRPGNEIGQLRKLGQQSAKPEEPVDGYISVLYQNATRLKTELQEDEKLSGFVSRVGPMLPNPSYQPTPYERADYQATGSSVPYLFLQPGALANMIRDPQLRQQLGVDLGQLSIGIEARASDPAAPTAATE